MPGGDVSRSVVLRQLEADIDHRRVVNEVEFPDAKPGHLCTEHRFELSDGGSFVRIRHVERHRLVAMAPEEPGMIGDEERQEIAPISAGVTHPGETLMPPSRPIANAVK